MIQEHNICESEKEFCSAGLQLRARGSGSLLVVARLLPCIAAQPLGLCEWCLGSQQGLQGQQSFPWATPAGVLALMFSRARKTSC